jgi:hypothetical protein
MGWRRATINRDIAYLRQQSKENIKKYINETLPEEYEKCLVGLNAITKEAWNTAQNTEDKREKILALSLAKECYSMKLDLLTNATVVDDAIRFVSYRSNDIEEETGETTTIMNRDFTYLFAIQGMKFDINKAAYHFLFKEMIY